MGICIIFPKSLTISSYICLSFCCYSQTCQTRYNLIWFNYDTQGISGQGKVYVNRDKYMTPLCIDSFVSIYVLLIQCRDSNQVMSKRKSSCMLISQADNCISHSNIIINSSKKHISGFPITIHLLTTYRFWCPSHMIIIYHSFHLFRITVETNWTFSSLIVLAEAQLTCNSLDARRMISNRN